MSERAPGDFKTKSQPKKEWKKWESDFAAACREVAKEPGHYNRIIRLRDSYDAGGKVMGDSDGDFIWVCHKRVYLVEAKFSAVHRSLSDGLKELVGKRQLGCHKGWSMLDKETLFIFRSSASSWLEFWLGSHVLDLVRGERWRLPVSDGVDTPENLKKFVRNFTRSE